MSLAENISKQEIIAAADQCVMCGLCLPHCPTYAMAKIEPESPRGRIALVRALHEDQLEASETIRSHLDHCLTCMNCELVCPANVDYEKIIDAGRAATRKPSNSITNPKQPLILLILSKTNIRKVIKTCISIFQYFNLASLFPNIRTLNLLPKTSISISNIKTDVSKKGLRVAVINSCAADLVSDQTFQSAKLILTKLGCIDIPQKNTLCCGALHQHTGDLKTANRLRKSFIRSFENQKLDHIISLATGCGTQIKRYPTLDGTANAHELTNKLIDINEFVLQHLKSYNLKFKPLTKKVYLHKPCSQQQMTEDTTLTEQLLGFIPEIEVVHFDDKLTCCGAGGMNTITHGKLANQLIENKIHEIKSSTANYLVSSNIGCALHFQSQIKHENIDVQVCHPITLLAQQVI